MAFGDMQKKLLRCEKCGKVEFTVEESYVFERDNRTNTIEKTTKHRYAVCTGCGNKINMILDPFFDLEA